MQTLIWTLLLYDAANMQGPQRKGQPSTDSIRNQSQITPVEKGGLLEMFRTQLLLG